ncbi:MAG: GTPase HflX [Lachnospiraceae bacterium]
MIENKCSGERAILVGVNLNNDPTFDHSMKELKELARACHLEVVCIHSQNLSTPNTALYIGSGKLMEVKEDLGLYEANTVIFDNALSPVQVRNLSRQLDALILDRTSLILRIFEERARTGEAKMQVELAKYQYMLPRLVGLRDNLSRQGGASGALSSKGAGEKKLELDRRRIEKQISELKHQLSQLELNRATMRKKRNLSSLSQVALVGYTNAGKSTILNQMVSRFSQDESKLVLEKDMLFATLETKVRQIAPPGRKPFLLSDTVGFIDKLPHQLIKAFRSTLQAVKEADLLLHVIDYSDSDMAEHLRVTQETLQELSAAHIPTLYVYNKVDKAESSVSCHQTGNRLYLSAKSEEGITTLLDAIEEALSAADKEVTLLIPFSQGHIVSLLTKEAQILSTEYTLEGTLLKVKGPASAIDRHLCYQVK